MTIPEILNTMEDMLEKAWNLPLTGGKCVMDYEKMQDLISEIRLNLPKEVKQAKMIVTDRKDILEDARKEADRIVQDAEKKASLLISNEEILKQARQKANDMLSQAHQQSSDLKQMTGDYINSMLENAEDTLFKIMKELKQTHNELRKTAQDQEH